MPKVGMEELRRGQLIEATIASIHEDGFAATTLQRIGKRAGLSPGLVAHYFSDKTGLIEATMLRIANELHASTVEKLEAARTPLQRLEAIIEANLGPIQFRPELTTAWLAFWALIPQSPRLARIQRINEARLHSNLTHALKGLVPKQEATELAAGLSALIDGLWLRGAHAHAYGKGDGLSSADARAIARNYLSKYLGSRAA
ncbi:MAG: transcriptional regulator BetI [Rhodovibrionaceae bacterium]